MRTRALVCLVVTATAACSTDQGAGANVSATSATAAATESSRQPVEALTTVSPTAPPVDTADPPATVETIRGSASVELLEHPLLAELTIEVDQPLVPVVRLVGPTGVVEVAAGAEPAELHTVLLAGLRADWTYDVLVHLLAADGTLAGALEDVSFTTGSLPDGIPPLEVSVSEPGRMAPGVTLFDVLDLREEFEADDGEALDPDRPRGWLLAVDHQGEIVWYHHEDYTIGDARLLDDGTILYEMNDTVARRIDLRGRVLDEWASELITGRLRFDAEGRQVAGDDAVVVATDSMHHEHLVLPDGNHATLSTELRVIDGFGEPQCGEDPATFDGEYHLIGDVVVIYEPASGAVVDEFTMFDYFDPLTDPNAFYVCGLPFDWVFPNWLYRDVDDRRLDWTHANGIEPDPAHNALLVSIRHLDAVVALRWKADADGPAGELLWQSGPIGDLELVAGQWHHHQHAPEVQPDGSILLYDNGTGRPGHGPEGEPLYSRAVRYVVDPEAGTAEQVWEYRSRYDGDPLFSPFFGDADGLPNGNVLISDGGVNGVVGDLSAQIVEVDPAGADGGDVVFRLELSGGPGFVVYRAERVASLQR